MHVIVERLADFFSQKKAAVNLVFVASFLTSQIPFYHNAAEISAKRNAGASYVAVVHKLNNTSKLVATILRAGVVKS